MGWLGWSFDQAMESDVCVILLAYQGKVAMLKQIFGSSDEPAESLPAFTPDAMRGLSKRH